MKTVLLALGLAAGLAASPAIASAEVTHRTSVIHNGQTVAISYEPQVETRLRQIGLGPRSSPACMWSSRIAIQRTAIGPDGRPIAALSRAIPGGKARSSQRAGHCSNLSERERARLAGTVELHRAQVIAAAERDSQGLRAELASLEALGTRNSHAR